MFWWCERGIREMVMKYPTPPPPLKKKEEKIKKENSSHSNTKSKDT